MVFHQFDDFSSFRSPNRMALRHRPDSQKGTPALRRSPLRAATLLSAQQALECGNAIYQPSTRNFTQLKRLQGQPPNRMTLLSPALIPTREYPQGGIDLPVAFPREPEPNNNTCPILRHNPGALDPEETTPAIAETTTATGTAIVTATATAVARARAKEAVNNKAAAPAVVAPAVIQSLFH